VAKNSFAARIIAKEAQMRYTSTALIALTILLAALSGCAVNETYITAEPKSGADIIIRQASAQNSDPYMAGRDAATDLKAQLGGAEPHAVLIAECFEDKSNKTKLLAGVNSVFDSEKVFGFSTYGSFGQSGALDSDSVGLLAIAGDGIAVSAALQQRLGIAGLTMEDNAEMLAERLHTAGAEITAKLPAAPDARLLILMADAHSPKNQFLVEGAQRVVGADFPITGGSANKNASQTFVYFQGKAYTDSAIAVKLSGDFSVSLAGRQAKENDKVISSAADGAAEALAAAKAKPFAVLAFNCAGRKGKLDNITDELTAIQSKTGKDLPMFGCYCAGEIGPPDTAEKIENTLSAGVGWHVMFTVLAK
jgi:hypothetical protein